MVWGFFFIDLVLFMNELFPWFFPPHPYEISTHSWLLDIRFLLLGSVDLEACNLIGGAKA